ncbi:protein FAM13A isoform X1 [Stigmatopora nigra]
MGAGALTICHNKTAVQVKEDMKKMVQMRPCSEPPEQVRLFGVSLLELQQKGLTEGGVPLVVRKMVEHLRDNALELEGLFRVNGSVRAVEALRQRLESDQDADIGDETDAFAVASLLKRYLRDLPQGLVEPAVQEALVQECSDKGSCSSLRERLKELPSLHFSLLSYLCHFLTQVDRNQQDNRMNAENLATVFGPNVFRVSPGFEALSEQTICNKILVEFIQNYSSIFEDKREENVHPIKVQHNGADSPCQASNSSTHAKPRTRKVRKAKREVDAAQLPGRPIPTPRSRGRPIVEPLSSVSSAEVTEIHPKSSQEEERPISPFYMSTHYYPLVHSPDATNILNSTIRLAVEQHLFDVHLPSDNVELTSRRPVPTARQRRRNLRDTQDVYPQPDRIGRDTNKENIPTLEDGSDEGFGWASPDFGVQSHGGQSAHSPRGPKGRKWKRNSTPSQVNQDVNTASHCISPTSGRTRTSLMEFYQKRNDTSRKDDLPSPSKTLRMKIQESPVVDRNGGEAYDPERDKDGCEDVPRLDSNNWGDPVPAYSREIPDRDEACLSPCAGGRLIRHLLEEDGDPTPSPRFYAYGQCQQYLDDTEVPPSPPNAHSFVSRRRSSSLGSCDDDKEELTTAQLTKRIHALKKKIHRFEERFEDERKYRPSHSDKAGNSEVLRWVNELARLRKDLKEHKLLKSEEDLPPLTRQRSNTLPKSFGSQLEKKSTHDKVPKPPVESTLDSIVKKLQEKRQEVHRPEDIKDMTREQIGAEKLALQKALLYYESIHGRPVTKNERQMMKPLYDRYRLVKQILCRASTIPVICGGGCAATSPPAIGYFSTSPQGSPSCKRRGPLLQPIIEGVTALFFDDVQEEEDGSEDDCDAKPEFSAASRPDLNVLSFLGHVEEDADGFISPVDELTPAKNVTDMRLSNLHSATTHELVEQLQETREEKKRIRKNLKEFEEQFLRQNGRNVQKEDRSPLAPEYSEYKHVKAKLKLLEVLISKRESAKFI